MDKQFKNRQFAPKCKRLIRYSLLSLYAMVAFNTNSAIAAPVGKLQDWRFSSQDSQLEISLSVPSRPLILGSRNLLPPESQSVGGELPANAISQLPPGAYSPLQSPELSPYIPQPPGAITPSQPSAPLPPGIYNNPSPLSPGIYNNPSLPPGTYNNPSQLPPGVNIPLPSIRSPLPLTPMNNGNTGQPTVSVPPITSTYSSPAIPDSVLPPARFPSPSGKVNSPPSLFPTPPANLPRINTPSNSVNPNESGVIEFGQPFPNPRR
ncbi:hypothetical protein Riv7116_2633 [Rivularia sp. PCC 7116]|uniref:hypothetical protein n=1 Tax=Rivularia sp. PCC 7116 TaxID=373994 RepID=UPI00029ED2A8|nr:hypothetical protein [Rivularia sp. PCC 7116]AFY55139.1 hypothetical protein Riv7116_2633 [Rivularia sp. PCC 7116]